MRIRHEIANQFFINWIERMFYEFTFYNRIEFSRKISQMNDLWKFVDTIFFREFDDERASWFFFF
jgi:hypothetical protein